MTAGNKIPRLVALVPMRHESERVPGKNYRDLAGKPLYAGIAFTGCYVLGALAAVVSALIFRRTFLKGPARPMIIELPTYKIPSLRTALLTTLDRAMVFLRKAGTVILAICVVLWWLGEYPHTSPPQEVLDLRAEAAQVETVDAARADELVKLADTTEAKHAKANSFMGRIGRTMEPVFEPLGYDWQLSIAVMSSLLAREVFVSTMAVVLAGTEDDAAENASMLTLITTARRSDGTPLFTIPAAASLLVYYVLAMQCLPTLAVTRRETGSWKWAAFQLVYMTGLAYVFAFVLYRALIWMGVS